MLTKNFISNMYGQPPPHTRTLETSNHVGLPPIKNQHVPNIGELSSGLQVGTVGLIFEFAHDCG